MSDTEETPVEQENAPVDEMLRMSQRSGAADDTEDAAVLSAAVVSAGAAMFLATWGSGVMGSGLPRVGYFVGIAIVSWFILTFILSNGILLIDGWLE